MNRTPTPEDQLKIQQQKQMEQMRLQQEQHHRHLQYIQMERQKQQQQQQQKQAIHPMHIQQPRPIQFQTSHVDPAILFQQQQSRDPAILSSQIENLNINETNRPPPSMNPATFFANAAKQQESILKPLDPSILFQQQQQRPQTMPFQDPAIISVSTDKITFYLCKY